MSRAFDWLRNLSVENITCGFLLAGIFVLPFSVQFLAVPGAAWQLGFFNAYAAGFITLADLFLLAGVGLSTLRVGCNPTGWVQPYGLAALLATILALPTATNLPFAAFALGHALLFAAVASTVATGFLPLKKVVATLAAAAGGQAVLAAGQVALGHSLGLGMLGESSFTAQTFNIAKIALPDGAVVRGLGTTTHANLLGGLLALALLFWAANLVDATFASKLEKKTASFERHFFGSLQMAAGRWRARFRQIWQRLISHLFLSNWVTALLAAGLFATFSRAAWLAAAVGLLILFINSPRKYLLTAFIIAIVFALGTAVTWPAVAARLSESATAGLTRTQLFTAVLPTIYAHPLGVGAGQVVAVVAAAHPEMPAYAWQPPHNFFALVALENGWPAAAAWLGVLLWLAGRAVHGRQFVAIAILAALFILSNFDHYFATSLLGMGLWWLALGVVCAAVCPPQNFVEK